MEIRFAPELQGVFEWSRHEAFRLSCDQVSPLFLLLGILHQQTPLMTQVFGKLGVDVDVLRRELEHRAQTNPSAFQPSDISDLELDGASTRVIKRCVNACREMNCTVIDLKMLLLGILQDEHNDGAEVLKEHDITAPKLQDALGIVEAPKDGFGFSENDEEEFEDEEEDDEFPGNAQTISKEKKTTGQSDTPALDQFGTDLTQAAKDRLLDPVVGREVEIQRVAQILSRRKKNNPILIGEPGVGKSSIAEGLAQKIVDRTISRALWDKRIVVLDLGSVVAGTKYRGQFEERIKAIINELKEHPEIIIFIDEIHTMIGAGSAAGSMDAANLMKPALSRGAIQCIGATTLKEYHKSIEKDGALERRFQKVMVEPTTAEQTLVILKNLRERYEQHHNVHFTDEALGECVRLAERYISDRQFPDKAIDIMDETGSRIHIQDIPIPADITHLESEVARLENEKNSAVKKQNFELAADLRDQLELAQRSLDQRKAIWEQELKDNRRDIDAETVAQVVSQMTGIPVQRIGQQENKQLRNMAESLKSHVVGQDEAIDTLVRSIQRSRVGLKDPNRPIGIFMFVGPTGVGKTYLTKQLAREVFGSEDALIRVDMSEFMEKHNVSRMVGAPPGYVGFEEGGELTEKVRRKPYSIVLFDEIEKAHHDVFNMLLQVMDEGRLTDGNGATIDFKNTIIVMTSNSGTRQLKDFGNGIGFQSSAAGTIEKERANSMILKSIKKQFAPEFLNRLDDIVYFNQLTEEAIQKIVGIELQPLQKRIEQQGYHLEVTPAARQLLGKEGYDAQYGARPLRRALQHHLEDPLCQAILDDAPIGTTFVARAKEGKIEIEKKQ
ncbi:MAG: ATP-dependent Clp protease ATP-binding subunit [Bacteroidaceae bacterium]|nr:ATP-dependent Clp protease ATP-binding subunit [Bacteroidaceae bacterium]